MKPIDTYYYLKRNKVSYNANSLIQLYYPIMGSDALVVYQYLTHFFDDGKREHKYSEILNHLQFGMSRLEEALVVLTALDLVVLYQEVNHYLIKLQPALELEDFLVNPIYKRLLEQKIGELALSELEVTIPNQARDISKKFSDVFGKAPADLEVTLKPKKNRLTFDLDSFQQLMSRDGLQFANEKEDVVRLYSIAEEYKMTWFDTYQLAKATAVNGKIAPNRIIAQKKQMLTQFSKSDDFTQAELVIIREAKKDKAQLFLEKIKKTKRATVTQDEKNLLIKLAQMDFLDEVINIMVLYTFNKTNSANLQKNYLLKIANDFSYQGVGNAEEAILKMRSFEDRKGKPTSTKAKASKTNVPQWSNPDYQEKTSSEEQEKLDKFKAEALKRLEKLKKGGD
ncbi:replicative DNA helicase [Streptococcus pseudoporcinus]|uniref:Replicative DNA helicase n=1 Tax=Streptococcus pseudoporcinus TaxID=361101 RepID=A0A4U9ZCT7_9STRE|nr:DnaD domain protein [Streptococcus pseudoporcinus]VTS37715.1 replicative DNA helicase [Streptococcus pseudoporcinus]